MLSCGADANSCAQTNRLTRATDRGTLIPIASHFLARDRNEWRRLRAPGRTCTTFTRETGERGEREKARIARIARITPILPPLRTAAASDGA